MLYLCDRFHVIPDEILAHSTSLVRLLRLEGGGSSPTR